MAIVVSQKASLLILIHLQITTRDEIGGLIFRVAIHAGLDLSTGGDRLAAGIQREKLPIAKFRIVTLLPLAHPGVKLRVRARCIQKLLFEDDCTLRIRALPGRHRVRAAGTHKNMNPMLPVRAVRNGIGAGAKYCAGPIDAIRLLSDPNHLLPVVHQIRPDLFILWNLPLRRPGVGARRVFGTWRTREQQCRRGEPWNWKELAHNPSDIRFVWESSPVSKLNCQMIVRKA